MPPLSRNYFIVILHPYSYLGQLSVMELKEILDRCYTLPEASLSLLESSTELIHYPKGHHILEMGKVERDIFFIAKGIARAYTMDEGREITFWIGKEGDTIVSMLGYVRNEPGYETIELMEDSDLYVLKRGALHELYEQDIHIANWGRKYAETELLETEKRTISLLLASATDRYKDLLRHHGDYLRRLPLGSIASYLGITQVTLSRIRSNICKQSDSLSPDSTSNLHATE